jgi:hypothetical protein
VSTVTELNMKQFVCHSQIMLNHRKTSIIDIEGRVLILNVLKKSITLQSLYKLDQRCHREQFLSVL